MVNSTVDVNICVRVQIETYSPLSTFIHTFIKNECHTIFMQLTRYVSLFGQHGSRFGGNLEVNSENV